MKLRHALIAVAVSLATITNTTPASAYTVTVVHADADNGVVRMVGTGVGVTTRSDSTMDVSVECAAVAMGNVAETGVDCYLRNGFSDPPVAFFSGAPRWTVGNASAFHLVFTDLPVANYVVCIGLGYTTSFGDYPDEWMNQGSGETCNNVSVAT